jgi:DNA (cytosine-5)-methyltransferase 1
MRYLSLFSGIEAVSQAWEPLGWECAAVSEILDFQSSIIKKNHPNLNNLGDVRLIDEKTVKSLGKIDIVVFGSPCQDMSVAGKRAGLEAIKEDTNHSSILFFEGLRVFRLAQEHCGARYMLWENVPGALYSNNGMDFAKILESMTGVEFGQTKIKWGNEGLVLGKDSMCEWAVLDAQWFGVAQRRRRVFALLDTGEWRDRQPILLEPQKLRGTIAPCREEREKTSETFRERTGISTFNRQAIGEYGTAPVASTVSARDYKEATDLVLYTIIGNVVGRGEKSGGNQLGISDSGVSPTITATDYHHVAILNENSNIIRKLTEIEVERLMGFPDNYTNVEGASYSKRINCLGRSMAVPVMKWIGEKIEQNTN